MNIIVIAPHPDDEILGCGGTLLKHKEKGDNIYIVYVTEMHKSQGYSSRQIEVRAEEMMSVQKHLGASIFQLSYYPTTLTDQDTPSMVSAMSNIFKKVSPQVVYLPNRSDVHSDHWISYKAAFACTKVFRYPSIKTVLMYETISETDFAPALPESVFMPNYFVDISEFLGNKIDLINIYSSELGKHPFPRSIESIKALAVLRGSMAGVDSAEAFQLLKHVDS